MISYRFYVASVVAFFLALGVGIVVGTGLSDDLAAGLRSRIQAVERNLDERVETVDRLNRRVRTLEETIEGLSEHATAGRLDGQVVVVLAEDGLDVGRVEQVVADVQKAGGRVPLIAWMLSRWALEEPRDRQDLEGLVESVVGDGASRVDDPRLFALDALVRAAGGTASLVPEEESSAASSTTQTSTAVGSPGVPDAGAGSPATTEAEGSTVVDRTSTTTTVVEVRLADLADRLREEGYLRVVTVGDQLSSTTTTAAGASPRQTTVGERGDGQVGGTRTGSTLLLVITGVESDLARPGRVAAETALAASGAGVPTALVELGAGGGEDKPAGALLEDLRRREADRKFFSTVDSVETEEGRAATVLALAELAAGGAGHYGVGEGADRTVPPWVER